MSDRFEINGKWYISSRRASQLSGYTSDYIGQLARVGKISSEMVGKARFVSQDDLRGYIENQKHILETSAEEAQKTSSPHSKGGKREPTTFVSFPISSPKLLSAGTVSFLIIALMVLGGYVFRGDIVIASWWEKTEPRIVEVSDMMTATVARLSVQFERSEKHVSEKVEKEEVEILHVSPSGALALMKSGWGELDTFVDDGLTGSVRTIQSLDNYLPRVHLAAVTFGAPTEMLQHVYRTWTELDAFVEDGLTRSVVMIQSFDRYVPRVSSASPLDSFRRVARALYTTLCSFVPGSLGCQEPEDTRFVGDTEVVEEARDRIEDSELLEDEVPSPPTQPTSPQTIVERVIERTPIVSASGVTVDDIQIAINALRDELSPRIDAAARSPRQSTPSSSGTASGDFLPLAGGTLTGALSGTDATFSGGVSSLTLSVSASTTLNGAEYLFPSTDGTNGQVLTTNGAGGLSWETVASGGGGSDTNWSFFNGSGVRLATTTNQVLIGASATTTDQTLEVIGGGYFSGNLGIGTTTPYAKLSVVGETVASHFTATTTATSTFPTLSVTGRLYDALGTGGISGNVLQTTGTGVQWVATSTLGLATSPGGADTYVQFNNGGSFGGDANFIWSYNNATLDLSASSTAQLLLPQSNDATTPTFAFGDGDTGFYESVDDTIALTFGGTAEWFISPSTGFAAINGAGPSLRNVGATAVQPTIHPNRGDTNTGVGRAASDVLSLIAGGTEILQLDIASSTFASVLDVTDTATSTFAGGIDLSAGCFAIGGVCVGGGGGAATSLDADGDGTNNVFVSSNAVQWDPNDDGVADGLISVTRASFPSGSASVPGISFFADTDTGFHTAGANILAVAAGGTDVVFFRNGALNAAVDGSATTPFFNWNSDQNTGLFHPAADTFAIATAGVERLRVDSGGNVGIATTSPWRTLSVTGTVSFDGLTTAGATGDALCRTSTNEVVVNTGAADCTVSSARFKENIETLSTGMNEVLALRPLSFTYIEGDLEDVHIGFLAEEVERIEPRLVFYGDDGRIRGVRYNEMVALLVKAIQELSARVDQLAAAVGSGASNTVNMVLERLTIGSSESPSGITLYDEITGEPYCLSVRNGRTITRSGVCGEREERNTIQNSFESVEEDSEEENASTTPSATTTPDTSEEDENNSTTTPVTTTEEETSPNPDTEEPDPEEEVPESDSASEESPEEESASEDETQEDSSDEEMPEEETIPESEPESSEPAPEEDPAV